MILICGDNHGHFDHIVEAALELRPKAIIFLGDIEAQRPLEEEIAPLLNASEVWFIPGNHDTDSENSWRNLAQSKLADNNLHGRVRTIAGLRIAGLGGVFRGEAWYPPAEPGYQSYQEYTRSIARKRPPRLSRASSAEEAAILFNKTRKHLSTIFPDVYEALYMERADILVTHEAPSCHPNGFAAIDELAQALGVKRTFHGHHHDCLNYRAFDAQLRFQAYGVGFCGIMDELGNQIVAGDFDEARRYRERVPEERKP